MKNYSLRDAFKSLDELNENYIKTSIVAAEPNLTEEFEDDDYNVRVFNIQWDTDDMFVELPTELFFFIEGLEILPEEEQGEVIATRLSDEFGYLVNHFDFDILKEEESTLIEELVDITTEKGIEKIEEIESEESKETPELTVVDTDANTIEEVASNAEVAGSFMFTCNKCGENIFRTLDELKTVGYEIVEDDLFHLRDKDERVGEFYHCKKCGNDLYIGNKQIVLADVDSELNPEETTVETEVEAELTNLSDTPAEVEVGEEETVTLESLSEALHIEIEKFKDHPFFKKFSDDAIKTFCRIYSDFMGDEDIEDITPDALYTFMGEEGIGLFALDNFDDLRFFVFKNLVQDDPRFIEACKKYFPAAFEGEESEDWVEAIFKDVNKDKIPEVIDDIKKIYLTLEESLNEGFKKITADGTFMWSKDGEEWEECTPEEYEECGYEEIEESLTEEDFEITDKSNWDQELLPIKDELIKHGYFEADEIIDLWIDDVDGPLYIKTKDGVGKYEYTGGRLYDWDEDYSEEDFEITDIDEEFIDEYLNRYLSENFENFESYKTVNGSINNRENRIILEGNLIFNSNKEQNVKFILEAVEADENNNIKFNIISEDFEDVKSEITLTLNEGLLKANIAEAENNLNETSHAQYAKPEGDRVAAYNNALKYAKKENKPFIYGYTQRGNGKFFALEHPVKVTGPATDAAKDFKTNYKRASVVFIAYPDKEFITEDLDNKNYGKLAWKLNEIIGSMNNEEAYFNEWLYLWPDGCSAEEAKDYFGTKEDYEELKELFERIYEEYHEDGLYTTDEDLVNYAHKVDAKLGLEPIKNFGTIKAKAVEPEDPYDDETVYVEDVNTEVKTDESIQEWPEEELPEPESCNSLYEYDSDAVSNINYQQDHYDILDVENVTEDDERDYDEDADGYLCAKASQAAWGSITSNEAELTLLFDFLNTNYPEKVRVMRKYLGNKNSLIKPLDPSVYVEEKEKK